MKSQIIKFVKKCQAICDKYEKDQGGIAFGQTLSISFGKKYAKIITKNKLGAGESVWAFVNIEDGNVFKPASWNRPAKWARGNINQEEINFVTAYGPNYLR